MEVNTDAPHLSDLQLLESTLPFKSASSSESKDSDRLIILSVVHNSGKAVSLLDVLHDPYMYVSTYQL